MLAATRSANRLEPRNACCTIAYSHAPGWLHVRNQQTIGRVVRYVTATLLKQIRTRSENGTLLISGVSGSGNELHPVFWSWRATAHPVGLHQPTRSLRVNRRTTHTFHCGYFNIAIQL
jgi:hypothetical protein